MVSPALAVRLWLDVENRGLEQLAHLSLSLPSHSFMVFPCGLFRLLHGMAASTYSDFLPGDSVSKGNKAIAFRFMT